MLNIRAKAAVTCNPHRKIPQKSDKINTTVFRKFRPYEFSVGSPWKTHDCANKFSMELQDK